MNIIALAEKKSMIEHDPEVMSATEIISAIARTKVLTIKDDGQEKQYSEMLIQAKSVEKALDTRRRHYTDPLNQEVKAIKAMFDQLAHPVKKKVIEIEGVIRKWRIHKAEEERKARERAEREQARIRARLEKQGMTEVPVPTIVTPRRETITRTESGAIHERKTWKVEVEDIRVLARAVADGQIPPHCIQPVISNLQALARQGVTNIPGCKVWQETSISTRSA